MQGLTMACYGNLTLTDLSHLSLSLELMECLAVRVFPVIPSIFLWIFCAFDITNSFQFDGRRKSLPWTKLLAWKMLSLVGMIALETTLFTIGEWRNNGTTYIPALRISATTLVFVLKYLSKEGGIPSSGVQFIYWTLGVAADSFLIWTVFIQYKKFDAVLILFMIKFVLGLNIWIVECRADKTKKGNSQFSPEDQSSFFSKITFYWFGRLIFEGYKKPLVPADLWELHHEYKSAKLFKNYQCQCKNTNNIMKRLFWLFGPSLLYGAVMKFLQDVLLFTTPLILKFLIGSHEEGMDESWKGYFYVGLLFTAAIGQTICSAQHLQTMLRIGMNIRAAMSSACYQKSLRLSNSKFSAGDIVNLVSTDIPRVAELMPILNLCWSAPLQLGICIYLLWQILGSAILAGLGLILILFPISGIIILQLRKLQFSSMRFKDERVKKIAEILAAVKIIKLHAWDPQFENNVIKIREDELKILRKTAGLNAAMVFIWTCTPYLVSLASFATFISLDKENVLSSKTVFVALTLFNMMRVPLSTLPTVMSGIIQAIVSLKRLEKFINAEEISSNPEISRDEENKIVVQNGSFSRDSADGAPVLSDINLKIKRGSLVAIIGEVGSGKSSLFAALNGEMHKMGGYINIHGLMAYTAQQPWLQNATVRENILFGKNFSPSKYQRVIEACALKHDFKILPFGDKTMIGEKGVMLSGGQKQRIALARAVYSDSDIYFMDDPLSAVDVHVSSHLFANVIGPNGILCRKTRLLVTSSLTHLHQMDFIVLMKSGRICEVGTYAELRTKLTGFDWEVKGEEKPSEQEIFLKRQMSIRCESPMGMDMDEETHSESVEIGRVKWGVYLSYAKAAGWMMLLTTISLHLIFQGFTISSNVWLLIWSDQAENTNSTRNYENLGAYAGLGIGQALSILGGSIVLVLGTLKAASALHSEMLCRIMRAPMSFFDNTDSGRILNRFAKDVDTCDTMLPRNFRAWLICFLHLIGSLGIVSYTTPLFLTVAFPAIFVYFILQRFYIPTSRQLRRLECISRSPIYSHFAESLDGVSTIRCFAKQSKFVAELENKVDTNHEAYFCSIVAEGWLGIRVELIGNILVVLAALLTVLRRDELSPGSVGLSLSSAFEITQVLNMLIRMCCDVENNVVAVERIKEYTKIEQEASWNLNLTPPPRAEKCSITFVEYSTQYAEGRGLALSNICCHIEPGENIGIVGRTGAGKSTLVTSLMRIVEASSGSILIDGENITNLGLHDLRTRITIIPQDTILFSGTIRYNLDPSLLKTDEEIWHALELAHMKDYVQNYAQGLDYKINDGGSNMSSGQRQLFCLARALLRKTKILILDEATGALDIETESLIQETIKKEFENSTVLTIAHRLSTIMGTNRVMVLKDGTIHEFDSPSKLIMNPSSIFYAMAEEANLI